MLYIADRHTVLLFIIRVLKSYIIHLQHCSPLSLNSCETTAMTEGMWVKPIAQCTVLLPHVY